MSQHRQFNVERSRIAKLSAFVGVVLLACHVALGLSASCFKSQTGDEGPHLAGGFSYWVFNDYRIQTTNGNWAQRWCGLPVWLAGYTFPSQEVLAARKADQWDLEEVLLYGSENDPEAMLLCGRMMTAILGVALGIVIYFWSKHLFGPLGGVLSLTLFAFSPTMLTHGFLITSDLSAALFFTAAVWSVWVLLHRVSPATLTTGWFTLSGLFLSKFSAPLIIPIGISLAAIRLCNRQPVALASGRKLYNVDGRLAKLGTIACLALFLAVGVGFSIWASFGFRYSIDNPKAPLPTESVQWETVTTNSAAINHLVSFAREFRLLPEAYLFGFAHTIRHSEMRLAYLNGELRRFGWISFFPYCVAMKTPLELFAMLALSAAAVWTFRGRTNDGEATSVWSPLRGLYEIAPLVALLVVYWAAALASHLNIGHRHILPTYPPLFILAGGAARWFKQSAGRQPASQQLSAAFRNQHHTRGLVTTMRILVASAVALSVAEALWYWPHYLAYFNILVGGPRNGYKHLSDSSLDWSQDLKGVKAWLDTHPKDTSEQSRLYFSFYGSPPPEYYGIHATKLPGVPFRWQPHVPEPLTGGTYIISASMLQCVMMMDAGRWNRGFEDGYQSMRHNVEVYKTLLQLPDGARRASAMMSMDQWTNMFYSYEFLRFSRLASFLRQRRPDDDIGYSILIYRLSDADVADALDGPPVELLDIPEGEAEDIRLGIKWPEGK